LLTQSDLRNVVTTLHLVKIPPTGNELAKSKPPERPGKFFI